MDNSLEATPIYESVCLDLGYRPLPTRINFNLAADGGTRHAMTIEAKGITWYFPSVVLGDMNEQFWGINPA